MLSKTWLDPSLQPLFQRNPPYPKQFAPMWILSTHIALLYSTPFHRSCQGLRPHQKYLTVIRSTPDPSGRFE
jgi:hypothetical protein